MRGRNPWMAGTRPAMTIWTWKGRRQRRRDCGRALATRRPFPPSSWPALCRPSTTSFLSLGRCPLRLACTTPVLVMPRLDQRRGCAGRRPGASQEERGTGERKAPCRRTRNCQPACKPGSVWRLAPRDDHSSGTHLAMRLTRPTRAAGRERPRDYHGILARDITAAPIRSCSRWGLPCRPCCQGRGALLPHRFALARGTGLLARTGLARAVCFLWHCPWGRPRRPLAGTVFPWSPDFPPPTGLPHQQRSSNCLARRDVRPRGQAVKRS